MTAAHKRRGTRREHQVAEVLRSEGWFVIRAAGSLGCADLVALKAGEIARLVEVKSTTRAPFADFGPAKRKDLIAQAKVAGAAPLVAWWPPRRQLSWHYVVL